MLKSLVACTLLCVPLVMYLQQPSSSEVEWVKRNAIVIETP